jgi:hypothetical protein
MSTVFEEAGGEEWASEATAGNTDSRASKPNGAHADSKALEPDRDVIRRHLELLFGRAHTEYPKGLCEIAWSSFDLESIPSANLFPITPEGLDRAADLALSKNLARFNVYVGVNPRKPKPETERFGRSSDTDVEIAFVHVADLDGAHSRDVEEALANCPLPFTFNVCTGRKPSPRVHPYWALEKPTRDMPTWKAQQLAISTSLGGDDISNPSRIVRLAGTVSRPKGNKVTRGYVAELTTLLSKYRDRRADRVTAEELYQAFPTGTQRAANGTNGNSHGGGFAYDEEIYDEWGLGVLSVDKLLARIRNGKPGTWHNDVRKLCNYMVSYCWPDSLILAIAEHITLPPFSVTDTRRDIQAFISSERRRKNFSNDETLKDPEWFANTETGEDDWDKPKPFRFKDAGEIKAEAVPQRRWFCAPSGWHSTARRPPMTVAASPMPVTQRCRIARVPRHLRRIMMRQLRRSFPLSPMRRRPIQAARWLQASPPRPTTVKAFTLLPPKTGSMWTQFPNRRSHKAAAASMAVSVSYLA